MLDKLQNLVQMDDPTFHFALFYLALMVAAAVAMAAWRNKAEVKQRGDESGRAKSGRSRHLQRLQEGLSALPVTPNQITVTGLVLVWLNCLFYLWHRDGFVLGTGLIVAYIFDTLDGLVARAQGTASRFGGYLDAVIDRYQEIATLAVIGWVTGHWLAAFLVMTGSMLTSYNKARAAIEIPVDNKGWPDFIDKTARQFVLCVGLIGSNAVPWLLIWTLWFLAAATHFTAVQRIIRAGLLIGAHEAGEHGQDHRQ